MSRFIYISLFIAVVASAKLPDPALTLLGGLFQEVEVGGNTQTLSIIPSANDHFQVVAFGENVGIVAKANVDSSQGDNLVLLRVPKDDGIGQRAYDYFLRTGEEVSFQVWYWSSPGDVETEEPDQKFTVTKEGSYSLPTGFGGVVPRSFTIINDGTPFSSAPASGEDNFETWIAGYTLSNASADADPDGDGLTNFQEWILGTDPRTSSDGFEYEFKITTDVSEGMDATLTKMRPTLVGRTYHIYQLNENMEIPAGAQPIHSYTPEVDSKDTYYEYNYTYNNTDIAILKIVIEINN